MMTACRMSVNRLAAPMATEALLKTTCPTTAKATTKISRRPRLPRWRRQIAATIAPVVVPCSTGWKTASETRVMIQLAGSTRTGKDAITLE